MAITKAQCREAALAALIRISETETSHAMPAASLLLDYARPEPKAGLIGGGGNYIGSYLGAPYIGGGQMPVYGVEPMGPDLSSDEEAAEDES